MKSKSLFALVLAGGAAVTGAAIAQDLGGLKGLAGGADLSSLAAGSAGNAAGVVEFCVKNNFLGGEDASSMKDKLFDKLGGDQASESDKADYSDGAKGLVKTGDGNSVDLGKIGGLKESLTKKACTSVLEHAKSLL